MAGSILSSDQMVRQQLAKISGTNPEDWFLTLKQRFGLAEVYRAIKTVEGIGEVIATPYTCITAINPIIVARHTPIYADIDPTTLSTATIPERLINKHTRAVVMQHTLGILSNPQDLIEKAHKHKLLIIEDSAHALLRFARDDNNEIIADISAHSFGVEKILPGTKFGGAIYLNPRLKNTRPELYETIVKYLTSLPQPTKSLSFRVKHYRFNNAILQRTPASIRHNLRDFAVKSKILEPAIYPFEQDAKQSESYAPNDYVNNTILKNLDTLKRNYARRLASVKYYNKNIHSQEFQPITTDEQPLLAYPILFKTEEKASQAYDILTSSGYFIRRWYSPLLYPGPNHNSLYKFDPSKTPKANSISARTLSLPTDLQNKELANILKLLQN